MNAVELHHITKRFGHYTANDDISLAIPAGEIHAIVGENGAGKSTLMKVLYGYHTPEAGSIHIDGREHHFPDPAAAIALGIGMVHQHFMLIPALTVLENIILGNEPVAGPGILSIGEARNQIRTLAEQHGFAIDPDAKVATLPVSAQQKVEILKILFRKARIIIFDEPTPVLTPQEVDLFLDHVRQLKQEGKTLLLITHKLAEVFAVSDRLTVLRGGKLIRTVRTADTTPAEVARLMTGQEIPPSPAKVATGQKEAALVATDLVLRRGEQKNVLNGLSLELFHGEILGLAGVENNGQAELVEVILGLRRPDSGNCRFPPNTDGSHRPISHIPDDRIRDGMIGEFSIEENCILGIHKELQFSTHSVYSHSAVGHFADERIRTFEITPSERKFPARHLSGGNQQKMVLAREFSKKSDIVLANQPTRGLDIKAIEFVHTALINQRNEGKAILLISSDLAELLKLSDRIAVIFEGSITAIFEASATTDKELGLFMTGVRRQSA